MSSVSAKGQGISTGRAGYVAVVGRPNVGKSTLINRLLGQKVAAVSPRPQTTRRRQLGILTLDAAQVILVDTPGIHQPVHKLGEFMNAVALQGLADADVILWLVDSREPPAAEDREIAGKIASLKKPPPVILVLNKADLLSDLAILEMRLGEYAPLLPSAELMAISSTTGEGITPLLEAVLERLPESPPYFSDEQVTDLYERDIAAELIREAALKHLREEIPHAMAVRIDEFKERNENTAYIAATLLVDKESHKGIVIGRQGSMLKTIGVSARTEIENMSGRRVYLDLRVKVNRNWRNNPDALRWLGYMAEKEA